MIRHVPFFATLSQTPSDGPEWRSGFAGLAVLRLIDAFRTDSASAAQTEAATIESARRAVSLIHDGDPARAILVRALNLLEAQKSLSANIGQELLKYGRALDLEGRWALAADVFQTISESFTAPECAELVIEASTALGAAARNTGDWASSDRGYAKAQHMADKIGNQVLSLTVRVGVAGSYMVHGNLPAAESELDEVLTEARSHNLQQVEAIAMHAQASVAHSRGDYQRAVHLAYNSLELTTNKTARDRILGDIAAAYAGLGMKDVARDGYSIVALISPHQWVRWQATLNLMELAIADGDERGFDDSVAQMQKATLDPRLHTYYLYFTGLGLRRFGRPNAEQVLESARDFASQHQLHQLAHEIEQSIESGEVVPHGSESSPLEPTEELQRVAEALMHLREDAVSQSS